MNENTNGEIRKKRRARTWDQQNNSVRPKKFYPTQQSGGNIPIQQAVESQLPVLTQSQPKLGITKPINREQPRNQRSNSVQKKKFYSTQQPSNNIPIQPQTVMDQPPTVIPSQPKFRITKPINRGHARDQRSNSVQKKKFYPTQQSGGNIPVAQTVESQPQVDTAQTVDTAPEKAGEVNTGAGEVTIKDAPAENVPIVSDPAKVEDVPTGNAPVKNAPVIVQDDDIQVREEDIKINNTVTEEQQKEYLENYKKHLDEAIPQKTGLNSSTVAGPGGKPTKVRPLTAGGIGKKIKKAPKNQSVQEAVEEGAEQAGKTMGKYKWAKYAVGATVLGGLVLSLSDSRGQQTNAQLYGQRPLY